MKNSYIIPVHNGDILPEKYGKWNTLYKRFNEWSKKIFRHDYLNIALTGPDLENIMISGNAQLAKIIPKLCEHFLKIYS